MAAVANQSTMTQLVLRSIAVVVAIAIVVVVVVVAVRPILDVFAKAALHFLEQIR